MVKFYILNINNLNKYTTQNLENVFPLRYKKAMSYKNIKDRKLCLGAGILLHYVIGLKESDIKVNEYGKLYSDKLNFSISHTEDTVVILTSDSFDVGIDIESPDRDASKIETLFHQNELEAVKNKKLTCIEVWTRKEALLKYLGIGLTTKLSDFDTSKDVLDIKNEEVRIYTYSTKTLVISCVTDSKDIFNQNLLKLK